MFLEPLSPQNLNEAIELAALVFPEDMQDVENPPQSFKASLDPKKYADFWNRYDIKLQRFFLAYQDNTDTVIGITSLYARTIDPPDVVWLGWYGIHPHFRGKGVGKELLRWTMDLARQEGNRRMRLYTSTNPGEQAAQHMYEALGFKIVPQEINQDLYAKLMDNQPGAPYEIMFREATL